MSLIGIDIGTSAIKVAAYDTDGNCLARARERIRAHRGGPGHWEVDPAHSVLACKAALATVCTDPGVRRDPPKALSFSSSGREVFPASADGTPLGPCLMAADHRGEDVADKTAQLRPEAEWFLSTGHVPRRMDPVNRIRWWQEHHPAVAATARWFLNWHEYYSLLMTGRAVTDASSAATWATYDLSALAWSDERISEVGIDPRWLPEVQRSGAPIGPITPAAAAEFSLPPGTLIVTGAWDLVAAGVGQGAVDGRTLGLTVGSWHSFSLPVAAPWPMGLLEDGSSVFPHPGPLGFAVGLFDPNGMSVIEWALDLFKMPVEQLSSLLSGRPCEPSPVVANVALSDLPHRRGHGGALTHLRLNSTAADILQSLLEAISCEFAWAVRRLTAHGYGVDVIRAAGGGSRNPWLMQLHADLTGVPLQLVAEAEPGAHGAAILAGLGSQDYASVDAATKRVVRISAQFEPSARRRQQYGGLLEAHRPEAPVGSTRAS